MKIFVKIVYFTYTANILWHTLEVDENIVTRIVLTQNFANKINANYGNIADIISARNV